jgi:alpha-beta hydrolase superfamily lysophospholipase
MIKQASKGNPLRGFFYGEILMKNRKRQRENRRRYKSDPRRNASGSMDMTAYLAIRNVMREEKKNAKKA